MHGKNNITNLSVAIVAMTFSVFITNYIFGHGSVGDPVSRVYRIYLENPETPLRDVSVDAIAVSGKQAFYNWSEINLLVPDHYINSLDAYRELIPDGQLASAGRAKYAGLALVRDDWPAVACRSPGSG